jgi:hypothetical protein
MPTDSYKAQLATLVFFKRDFTTSIPLAGTWPPLIDDAKASQALSNCNSFGAFDIRALISASYSVNLSSENALLRTPVTNLKTVLV